ncbi:hypothetical protein POPTR_014G110850v4 [Populus trichocarpa]|uniref:Uncharacterized protein n=1 Tax=Populus trichocarpa TaxID=3694 RepID=A0ACC0RZ98_POPTR|nr:hypothetical protein POPTR_014G110850v4 [Populus trichocarpa]
MSITTKRVRVRQNLMLQGSQIIGPSVNFSTFFIIKHRLITCLCFPNNLSISNSFRFRSKISFPVFFTVSSRISINFSNSISCFFSSSYNLAMGFIYVNTYICRFRIGEEVTDSRTSISNRQGMKGGR